MTKSLRSAAITAASTLLRVRLAPFVDMVTHSATVNHGGGLRKTRERVYANPCHYAQAMFAAFAEAIPIKIELTSPTQTAPLVLPDLKNVTTTCSYRMIDALAAKSSDGSLLISLVHRGTSEPVDLEIVIKESAYTGQIEIQTLTADVPWATNTLETPEVIIPVNTAGKIENGKMLITIKPYSVFKDNSSKVPVNIVYTPDNIRDANIVAGVTGHQSLAS